MERHSQATQYFMCYPEGSMTPTSYGTGMPFVAVSYLTLENPVSEPTTIHYSLVQQTQQENCTATGGVFIGEEAFSNNQHLRAFNPSPVSYAQTTPESTHSNYSSSYLPTSDPEADLKKYCDLLLEGSCFLPETEVSSSVLQEFNLTDLTPFLATQLPEVPQEQQVPQQQQPAQQRQVQEEQEDTAMSTYLERLPFLDNPHPPNFPFPPIHNLPPIHTLQFPHPPQHHNVLSSPNLVQHSSSNHTNFKRETRPPSPPRSPSPSNKRPKKNFTKEFSDRFHALLDHNEDACRQWQVYAQKHKNLCTIRRPPCIKVLRGFCASYGHEFTELACDEKYGALGTRTECMCRHKPMPLSSSPRVPSPLESPPSLGPARTTRTHAHASPYSPHDQYNYMMSSSSSSKEEMELPLSPPRSPASPATPMTQESWGAFIRQASATMQEGLNAFLGGAECQQCHHRRPLSQSEVVSFFTSPHGLRCGQYRCPGSLFIKPGK